TNPFYAGFLTFGRYSRKSRNSINDKADWTMTKFKGIDRVITIEEWEQCWDIYSKKSKGEINPKLYKTTYLFKDIIFCAHCKAPFICKDQRTTDNGRVYGNRIYRCPNKKCSNRHNADELHEYLMNEIFSSVQIKALTTPPRVL